MISALNSLNSNVDVSCQIGSNLENYVSDMPNNSHRFLWSTASNASAIGIPVAGPCYYDIIKVNAGAAVVKLTQMTGRKPSYIKRMYGGTWNAWEIYTPGLAEYDSGDVLEILPSLPVGFHVVTFCENCTNKPTGSSYFVGFSINYSSTALTVYGFDNNRRTFARTKTSDAWSEWKQVSP